MTPRWPIRAPIRTAAVLTVALSACLAVDVVAQDDPVHLDRRAPTSGFDPFRYVAVPRSGLAVFGQAAARNNALNLDDVGALIFLSDRDSLRVADAMDALGLVPAGVGLEGAGEGSGGVHLGWRARPRLTVGLSARAHAYGAFQLDDDAVALLRDGNGARSEFSLGRTRGTLLGVVEVGVHGVLRVRRREAAGPVVDVGAGLRHVSPAYLVRTRTLLENGGVVRITGDSVRASVLLETGETPDAFPGGSGVLADGLIRAVWPEDRFALEAMLLNVGGVSVEGVERRRLSLELATTRLDTVVETVDALALEVRDTTSVSADPPAVLALTVSTSRLPGFQLDARLTAPLAGEFERPPPEMELLGTLRPFRWLPVWAGVGVGGHRGVGYTAGAGVEKRRFFVRTSFSTFGGFLGSARGLAGRLAIGAWL